MLEIRRRNASTKSVRFPAVVLVCAVTLSLDAQVVEAGRSVIGWLASTNRLTMPALADRITHTPLGGGLESPFTTYRPALPAAAGSCW